MCVCKRNWQFQQMVSCTPQCQSPHLDAHWFLRDTRLCSDTLTCLQARARRCVDLLWTNEGRKHEAQHRLTPLNLLFKHIETSQKLSAQKNEQEMHALPVSALIKVLIRSCTGLTGLLALCSCLPRVQVCMETCLRVENIRGFSVLLKATLCLFGTSSAFRSGEQISMRDAALNARLLSQQDAFQMNEMAKCGAEGELLQRRLGVKEQQNGELGGKV